ncbi:hypothetical protein B0H10DRAFT_1962652 [Mycena sp. CBHHK59/15]|nr:hypothetical protein B0H10DRAFT_1962652 [Mycena sp. CBHHK59/15]
MKTHRPLICCLSVGLRILDCGRFAEHRWRGRARHGHAAQSNAGAFKVDRLRQEVERLVGQVEVLCGVVEEGLREQRAVREVMEPFEAQSAADVGMSEDLDSQDEMSEEEHHPQDQETEQEAEQEPVDDCSSLESDDESEAGHFISDKEVAHIAVDVEERSSTVSAQRLRKSPTPGLNGRTPVSPCSASHMRARKLRSMCDGSHDTGDGGSGSRWREHTVDVCGLCSTRRTGARESGAGVCGRVSPLLGTKCGCRSTADVEIGPAGA